MERKTGLTCKARDGTRLSVDVYLPDGIDEPIPALVAVSQYGKALQEPSLTLQPQPRGRSPLWDCCIEAGDIRRLTDNGYAHIIADLRGTGDSEGEYCGIFGSDGEDGYDLVEWAADQDWCSGQVGMVGRSWFGTNQLLVAAENPPSLEAVFPAGVFTDLYRDFAYHGGVLSLFMYGLYDGRDGGQRIRRTKCYLGRSFRTLSGGI